MLKKILLIFGTRPEAIKMAPLYWELKKSSNKFLVKVCSTGQHREMLKQVIDFFGLKIDYDLSLMKENQNLFDVTSEIIKGMDTVLSDFNPDLVFVQGDTTTALCGGLTAFYKKVTVAHLEAGLRSYDKYSPFPEEINRVLLSDLADLHFAPTKKAKENLKKERIFKNVWVVGNTAIDALLMGLKIIENRKIEEVEKFFDFLDFNKKTILVTSHRRESFGQKFESICKAIKKISEYSDVQIVYPVHLNPNVREPVYKLLKDIPNVYLLEPLSYPYLIYLMKKSYMIMTDSGGIKEEAPSLKKPVVVLRDVTERVEGVKAGSAVLVGTKEEKIFETVSKILYDDKFYNSMVVNKNPYGDGKSSKRIKKILEVFFD